MRSHCRRTPVESRSVSSRRTPSAYGSSQTWVGMPLNRRPPCRMPAEPRSLRAPSCVTPSSVTASSSEVPKKRLPAAAEGVVDLAGDDRVKGVVAARSLRHRADDRLADVDEVVAGDGIALEVSVAPADNDETAPARRRRDGFDRHCRRRHGNGQQCQQEPASVGGIHAGPVRWSRCLPGEQQRDCGPESEAVGALGEIRLDSWFRLIGR